jgi:hypothetical protein
LDLQYGTRGLHVAARARSIKCGSETGLVGLKLGSESTRQGKRNETGTGSEEGNHVQEKEDEVFEQPSSLQELRMSPLVLQK